MCLKQHINTSTIARNNIPYLKEDNLYKWEATIKGAPDIPYEGGNFLLDMVFTNEYLFKPPKVSD